MKKLLILIISIFFINLHSNAQQFVQTYNHKNKLGLIYNNEKITEPIYSKLIRLGDKSWICQKKNKYGIISNAGELLVEPKYTQAYRFSGGKFARLGSKDKYALYNELGQAITKQEYSKIDILYGKMFLVEKNYKYGLIDYDGNIILAPIAEDIYMPKPNIIRLKFDNLWYEIEQKNKGTLELPKDIINIKENVDDFKVTQLIQKPIKSTTLGVVSASDYFIKIFSSISPAYEQTIDELILNYGADTATILFKFSWLYKFPFVYGKNYFNNLKAPNNGPLSDVKTNLKNEINKK